MNEEDFIDAAYLLSSMGLIIARGVCTGVAEDAWAMAEHMAEVRKGKPEPEEGIVAIKKPRRKV